jgi:hypothetical protein
MREREKKKKKKQTKMKKKQNDGTSPQTNLSPILVGSNGSS